MSPEFTHLEGGQAAYCWESERFKTRQKSKEYVGQVLKLGHPPLPFPDVFYKSLPIERSPTLKNGPKNDIIFQIIWRMTSLYRRFGVLPSGTAGWDVYAHRSDKTDTSLWGPVVRHWYDQLGGSLSSHTNSAGEVSAICHALKWLSGDSREHASGTLQ